MVPEESEINSCVGKVHDSLGKFSASADDADGYDGDDDDYGDDDVVVVVVVVEFVWCSVRC